MQTGNKCKRIAKIKQVSIKHGMSFCHPAKKAKLNLLILSRYNCKTYSSIQCVVAATVGWELPNTGLRDLVTVVWIRVWVL